MNLRIDSNQRVSFGAFRKEIRAPLRASQTKGVGVDTAVGKLGAWRDWNAVLWELRWCSGATTTEAAGRRCKSRNADSKRLDPGLRRSGSGIALDDAHDLQGAALVIVFLVGCLWSRDLSDN